MGWAVGERDGRHIGYGVPAECEQPECRVDIDRGLDFACGGGVTGKYENNCGRFFCHGHLYYVAVVDGELVLDDDLTEEQRFDDDLEWVAVCARCATRKDPFPMKPDSREWAIHVLNDISWAEWREDNPQRVNAMRQIVEA
jgi:hypothetical protein